MSLSHKANSSVHPNIDRLFDAILGEWPEHARFIRNSFSNYDEADLGLIEDLSERVCILAANDLGAFIKSYRWMCAEMNKEALYFKKHGVYRLSTFSEANKEVYSNAEFMKRYMEGLLVSQVFWRNHSAAFLYFQNKFLPSLRDRFRYLEVGPGHGLFLSVAAEQPACEHAEAWDVSEESLRQTGAALDKLGLKSRVDLVQQDIHAPTRQVEDGPLYDGIAICEVLEHLERPKEALMSLRRFLRPDGVLFINVPINSPAPDHIFLLRDVNAVRDLVEAAGLTVLDLHPVAMTGYSLAEANRQRATVNCFVLAQ
jgi:2-polyprenyl-3-methyl-5-hydroxy-6-metoxy-1,4-benzoquinol methylase